MVNEPLYEGLYEAYRRAASASSTLGSPLICAWISSIRHATRRAPMRTGSGKSPALIWRYNVARDTGYIPSTVLISSSLQLFIFLTPSIHPQWAASPPFTKLISADYSWRSPVKVFAAHFWTVILWSRMTVIDL